MPMVEYGNLNPNKVERCALRHVATLARMRQDFNCNNTLKGETLPHRLFAGRLPAEWSGCFWSAMDANDIYVVYSYGTPIAWYANGIWTMPDVRYSVTTSRHQSALGLERTALH